MFTRVLVANRGEIAVRVIRGLHELGIEAVAVYSTADADSLHVRLADRAIRIGPPAAGESYLRIPSVIAAATTTGCQAVHPGYGFLSENPAFARACADNDLVFVGPSADVMERMGDKARAKAELGAAGVPLVPGTDGAASLAEVREAAAELGYPVLLKAVAGGGGKGMRLVHEPDELEAAYATASGEAGGRVRRRRRLSRAGASRPRATSRCRCWRTRTAACSRSASASARSSAATRSSSRNRPRRPSTPSRARHGGGGRACRARTIGYENAGTFEFLLGPDGRFFFIELNCRLQVEHPVSELVTGVDIVREQLRIAAGEQLLVTGRADRRGHAIEIRVNAEDPSRGFAPAPGLLTRFRPPLGAGVRVDTFVEEGMTISPYYDSLLAKVCVWAETREAAIARGIRALGELELEGVPTTRELALDILRSDAFTSGDYSTGYLAEMQDRLPSLAPA